MISNMENTTVWIATIFTQSSVLILLGITCSLWYRWNAAARHTILLATLIAIFSLPLASICMQQFELSIWPTIQSWMSPGSSKGAIEYQSTELIEYEVQFAETNSQTDQLPISSPWRRDLEVRAAMVWAAVTLIFVMRICFALFGLRKIRQRATLCENSRVQAVVRRVRKQIRIKTHPPVFLSAHVRTPVAIGVFRPAILLPDSLVDQLSEPELRNILIHEFAHIKRRDHAVLVLQKIAGVLFWPQPLLHLLNRMLSRSREEICDNYVLHFSEKVSYGETLLKLTEHGNPAFSLGLLGSAWKLEDRISQLLSERRNLVTSSNLFLRSTAWVTFGIATVGVSLATPLAAEETPQVTAVVGELTIDSGTQIIELKTADAKPVVAQTKNKVLFIGTRHGEFDDTELSPGDKAVAEELKQKYKSLKEQQSEIAEKLKKTESRLNKLGVKLSHAATVVNLTGPKTLSFESDGSSYTISKGKVVQRGKLDIEIPKIPKPVVAVSEITLGVAPPDDAPDTPSQPTPPTPKQKTSDSVEKRLQRLELLIEKVIESNEKVRDDASESDL